MKTTLLFCLSLIAFANSAAASAFQIDLAASQTITAGSNVEVKLTVSPTGNDMSLTALSGVKIKTGDTSVTLTCTIGSAITCTTSTAGVVPCTATLSVAGTYTLDSTSTVSYTATSDGGALTGVTPSLGTTTATVSAAADNDGSDDDDNGGSDGNGSDNNDKDGSNYISISFILLLFGFLL